MDELEGEFGCAGDRFFREEGSGRDEARVAFVLALINLARRFTMRWSDVFEAVNLGG